MNRLKQVLTQRYGIAVWLIAVVLSISFLTRLVLFIRSVGELDFTFLNILGILFIGLFFDLVNSLYVLIPLMIYLWLFPERWFSTKAHRIIIYGVFSLFTFLLIFNAASEWFFWDEFNTRYNFIAVDYLVYTNEVLGNIQESYPIPWIVLGILTITVVVMCFLKPQLSRSFERAIRFKKRSVVTLVYIGLVTLIFFGVSNSLRDFSANTYVNELSGNGLYELFAAYRNNELDYNQFYADMGEQDAFATVRMMLKTPEATYISNDPTNIERQIVNPGDEKRLNVVLISVESLSAHYMEVFGGTLGITPNLDSLSKHSILYTNLYATGTRTVRGLEALSLCVPPTPGQSIVRRPQNEGLFSMGKVFKSKGYDTKYIYGGYGYFDNMNYFFGNNSYDVVDRTALSDNEIDYENVWGVADENLFTLATREIEKSVNAGKPVFAHVMTTSNHRPYTYPEGRIDIPSHTGRAGAVKYTDYAIGKFLRDVSTKPWFSNTLFIVVADHCASSAGKTELPIDKYHIPMLVYSPSQVTPAIMDRLMSQIDIGPTILGMLNFSYTSKFYGYDMAKLEPGRERIFISTYQLLGYSKGQKLIILSPQKKVETFTITNKQDGTVVPMSLDKTMATEAKAWYEAASISFQKGLMH